MKMISGPSPASREAALPADNRHMANFIRDERGVVFMEFIIVLFAFLFLLLGTIQLAFITMASYYVNYGNFMALRTASVWQEAFETGLISQSAFDEKCEDAAISAMEPIEHFLWHNPLNFSAKSEIGGRLTFIASPMSDGNHPQLNSPGHQNQNAWISGRLEYDYRMFVPFANQVFGALADPLHPGEPEARRIGDHFVGQRGMFNLPRIKLRSNDSVSELAGNPDPPRPHVMIIQRRWRYNNYN